MQKYLQINKIRPIRRPICRIFNGFGNFSDAKLKTTPQSVKPSQTQSK